eukprot:363357-Chlamydomonas_euryale.AAC.18
MLQLERRLLSKCLLCMLFIDQRAKAPVVAELLDLLHTCVVKVWTALVLQQCWPHWEEGGCERGQGVHLCGEGFRPCTRQSARRCQAAQPTAHLCRQGVDDHRVAVTLQRLEQTGCVGLVAQTHACVCGSLNSRRPRKGLGRAQALLVPRKRCGLVECGIALPVTHGAGRAYDSMIREALWEVFKLYGVHPHVIRLLEDLRPCPGAVVQGDKEVGH